MEALAAVSLAGNVVAFVDFASKVASQVQDIYKSASGASQDNLDIQTLIDDLSVHSKKLSEAKTVPAAKQKEQQQLQSLAKRCVDLAGELDLQLQKLQVDKKANMRRLRSLGKGFRSVFKKNDMEEKMRRLSEFRGELEFGILNTLK